MTEEMQACRLCPRNCGVNRAAGQTGFCGQTDQIRIARAALHYWEEPCISGKSGSGAVFFNGCNVRCVFCQNVRIARNCSEESMENRTQVDGAGGENALEGMIKNTTSGRIVSKDELARIFLDLQEKGANNINLVTPTHFLPQIAAALEKAKQRGLVLPIVYNTSSYEYVDKLKMLEGLVDIYLPDLKYISSDRAKKYSGARDYFYYALRAIEEMVRQTGAPVIENGLMKRGVIVRHLCMPGGVKEAKAVLSYLHEKYGEAVYISIMNQYTPLHDYLKEFPEIDRKLTKREYERVLDYALEIGITNAFIQEGDVASESFIPEFE